MIPALIALLILPLTIIIGFAIVLLAGAIFDRWFPLFLAIIHGNKEFLADDIREAHICPEHTTEPTPKPWDEIRYIFKKPKGDELPTWEQVFDNDPLDNDGPVKIEPAEPIPPSTPLEPVDKVPEWDPLIPPATPPPVNRLQPKKPPKPRPSHPSIREHRYDPAYQALRKELAKELE